MRLPHDDGWNIPADAPFYRPLPAAYRGVKMQFVFFHAAAGAVHTFLPEPLQAHSDGMCVAGGIDIPESHYGAFQESFLMLHARFGDMDGFYCSHVFHNGPAGIAAGREIYGTPKVYADIKLQVSDPSMLTETLYQGSPVLTVRSETREPFDGTMPSLGPAWRLKVIPRADGPRPAIKQLVDCSEVTRNLVLHESRQGHGEVRLGACGALDLRPLAPIRYGKAIYWVCDYEEAFARIAYDYLAGR